MVPKILGSFLYAFSNLGPVYKRVFHTKHRESHEISLVLGRLAPFSFDAPVFFSCSLRSNLVPHATTSVPSKCVLPSRVIVGVNHRIFRLLHFATMPYSSMQRHIPVFLAPHLALCHKPNPPASTATIKKQSTIALSSGEAERVAALSGACEGMELTHIWHWLFDIWMPWLLFTRTPSPTQILSCD